MSKIELECPYCNSKFLRRKAEHNRSIKLGRKEFCSNSCGSKFYENKHVVGRPENLIPNNRQDQFSPFRYFLKKVKTRSKKNSVLCLLTLEQIKNQWEKQNGKCAYSGIKMHLPRNLKDYQDSRLEPHWASLDRINSSRNYEEDNIQFICVSLNFAKNKFTHEEFLNFFKTLNRD